MTLVILFSLQTMQSLKNGVATHSQATPFFSVRTESLASSQICRSTDDEAWCKRDLTVAIIVTWYSGTSQFSHIVVDLGTGGKR